MLLENEAKNAFAAWPAIKEGNGWLFRWMLRMDKDIYQAPQY